MTREQLAETIHKARWPNDHQMDITPFADEDRSGREYCFRIADAVLLAFAKSLALTLYSGICPDCGRTIDGPTHAAYCKSDDQ